MSTKQAIFVDSSISDTIRTCIVLGNHRAAMRVKAEFKVMKVTIAITDKMKSIFPSVNCDRILSGFMIVLTTCFTI